jgi:hypothetical protein
VIHRGSDALAAAKLGDILIARSPSKTMRIFSSAEYCRRVWRRVSFSIYSAGASAGPEFCFIFAATMNPKSSIRESPQFVSGALMANTGVEHGSMPSRPFSSSSGHILMRSSAIG